MTQGKSLDMTEAMPVIGSDVRVIGSNSYDETAGSDIVAITTGLSRKPGMSRDDLLDTNSAMVRSVVNESLRASPGAIFIILTNPLDAMSYLAMKVSGLSRERIIGQAGILDSIRMRSFVAMELGVSVQQCTLVRIGWSRGRHGSSGTPLECGRHSVGRYIATRSAGGDCRAHT